MTQAQIRLQLRPPQIEIAILQSEVFRGQRGVGCVELKRQGARVIQNADLFGLDFDIAGRDFRIPRVFIAPHDFANNREDVFAAHIFRFRVRVSCLFLIDDNLRDAVTIAEVDERQRTKIAAPRAPAHQRHACADAFFAQGAARVRARKIFEVLDHRKTCFGLCTLDLVRAHRKPLTFLIEQSTKLKDQSTKKPNSEFQKSTVPPSTLIAWPLMPRPSSEASKTASAATSSAVTIRFCGLMLSRALTASSAEMPVRAPMVSTPRAVISVST